MSDNSLQPVKIISRKFDGRINHSWEADLIQDQNPLYVCKGIFKKEIHHNHLGHIKQGTVSYEYFWRDRWYNVFRFFEPNGEFKFIYCNICMPPAIYDNMIEYVDLDLDILVYPDNKVQVLDVEEFHRNARHFKYPPDVVSATKTQLTALLEILNRAQFPFLPNNSLGF
ncbi:MAG: DUF402 domain-containing protein [Acidobacteria bacterium]|nr:DUF402 domain-containing protein [Acidobacteriota bacterium]